MLRLSAQQSLTLQVPRRSVPLRHYLKQPHRLVNALMNPSQVEALGQGEFRLHLRAIDFLMINIRPVVDLHIDVSQDRVLKVRSTSCTIHGSEFINQRFELSLSGILNLGEGEQETHVKGQADLAIAIELPPILQATPQGVLETTGNQILKGILLTMKQRLARHLVADYERWSTQQTSDQDTEDLSLVKGPAQAS